MKAFLAGLAVALVLGIGTGIAYTSIGITTAERHAAEGVVLPEDAVHPPVQGRVATAVE